jgi:hypothetical protein
LPAVTAVTIVREVVHIQREVCTSGSRIAAHRRLVRCDPRVVGEKTL